MTRAGRIAVIGEALVDVVPVENGMKRAVPGGSGLNTALGLARLEAPVSFCGALSRDADGASLADVLTREGVDLSHAHISDRPCPRVFVTPGADGSPHYDLHLARSALEDTPVSWSLPGDLAHLHATSFAATTGPSGAAALSAMKEARAVASTSFDPNIRAAVLPPMHETRALIAERIAQADVVKASEEDLALLAEDPERLLKDWRALGPKLIIVTQGARGATALFGDDRLMLDGVRVNVCDTVGAGDTFMAALLTAMREHGALGPGLRAFDKAEVGGWLRFATQAAAMCCARPGADPPHRADVGARR